MNLIICMTPLQVLIAEKIIENYKDDKFYKIMIMNNFSKKYIFYKDRFFYCNENNLIFMNNSNNKISMFINWLKIKIKSCSLPKLDKVFCANINAPEVQLILSTIDFERLYTFDDGSANLVKSSNLYKDRVTGRVGTIVLKLLNNKFSSKRIREESTKHFSIYKEKDNIIPKKNIHYISLFNIDNKHYRDKKERKNISIFLGQPIYELVSGISNTEKCTKNLFISDSVINCFNVDYYYPHPRENYKISNVTYIDSELIFEDYMATQFSSDINYTIYTFFSSAVFPFIELSNVKIVSLRPKDYPKYLNDNYELMKNFGIDIIEI